MTITAPASIPAPAKSVRHSESQPACGGATIIPTMRLSPPNISKAATTVLVFSSTNLLSQHLAKTNAPHLSCEPLASTVRGFTSSAAPTAWQCDSLANLERIALQRDGTLPGFGRF